MGLDSTTLGIHVAVMLAWTLVIIVALLMKRYVQNSFKLYIWLQSVGIVMMLLGCLGISILAPVAEGKELDLKRTEKAHIAIGIITIVMAVLQPVTGICVLVFYHYCSHSDHEILTTWYYKTAHRWLGKAILVLVLVEIFTGILLFVEDDWELGSGPYSAMLIIFFVLLGLLMTLTIFCERKRKIAKEDEKQSLIHESGY